MSTNMEELIREAAVKNRTALEPDDPVLILVTIMNRIVADQSDAIAKHLEQYKETHEDIADRWRRDATGTAERILNAALYAGRDSMEKGMTEGAAKVAEQFDEKLNRALALHKAEFRLAFREFKRSVGWLLAATGAVLAAAGAIVVWL
ncbi:MAG: conjugal transfer protein TraM [Planctomycetaceae bacterium]|nr:conjugal transfer protein TraM [Planctomycetaceae bacterium]